jgi:hypothetical protein
VRASMLLFCRLTDMEEFDTVLAVMIRQEQEQVIERLGVHYYFRQVGGLIRNLRSLLTLLPFSTNTRYRTVQLAGKESDGRIA